MAEPHVIRMPQLSDTTAEGVIVSWEKNIGDKIERGAVVATVEADEANMDVEVCREGYLSGPIAPVDSTVPAGEAIAYIVESADEVEGGEPAAAPTAEAVPAAADPVIVAESATPSAGEAPADAPFKIEMPRLSDSTTEAVLVSWEKEIGDRIECGTVVASVEIDKATMDVEVFREGYLSGPRAAIDSVIPVGGVMAYLVEEESRVVSEEAGVELTGTDKQESPAPAAPALNPDDGNATPYARQLAASLNVNLDKVTGTGPHGEITGDDVRRAQPVARPTEVAEPIPAHVLPQVQVPGHGRPMTAMEKAVSDSMTASLTMPTFHASINAEAETLIKASREKGVSVTVSIARACALAMARHPAMNRAYQPVDKLVERSNVDIGMAVSAEGGGLVVPVLRGCETRSLEELNESWQGLVERARKRRLAPEEYANPTFLVSNLGMMGVSYFDAIPTPGTAAILAIAAAGPEGMPLTITADHRVVNGAEVGMFLNTLKGYIENPGGWMEPSGAAIPEDD